MTSSRSAIGADVLVFRRTGAGAAFFFGHPGGPLWAEKDAGAWMVLKGLIDFARPSGRVVGDDIDR